MLLNRFFLLFFISLYGFVPFVFGWGGTGHRAVAAIAEGLIKLDTEKEIRAILGEDISLAEISSWADEMKEARPHTSKWHYVNMEKNSDAYDQERDCPDGECLISVIGYFQKVLSDKKELKEKREEALKFLVHFIGDLHQPLHCGYQEDVGGNNVAVKFFGADSNLHKVWDDDIIRKRHFGFNAYVEKQIRRATPDTMEKLQQGTALDWYFDSRSLLQSHVYAFDSDRELEEDYYKRNISVIHNQLLKAGIRLAGVLDRALSGEK